MLSLKVLVRKQTTKEGKSFNVLNYRNPQGIYYKVKFTQKSGITITKLEQGLYDMLVDESNISTQIKKNGDYVEHFLWVDDEKCKFTKHEYTAEELEEKKNRVVNELIG